MERKNMRKKIYRIKKRILASLFGFFLFNNCNNFQGDQIKIETIKNCSSELETLLVLLSRLKVLKFNLEKIKLHMIKNGSISDPRYEYFEKIVDIIKKNEIALKKIEVFFTRDPIWFKAIKQYFLEFSQEDFLLLYKVKKNIQHYLWGEAPKLKFSREDLELDSVCTSIPQLKVEIEKLDALIKSNPNYQTQKEVLASLVSDNQVGDAQQLIHEIINLQETAQKYFSAEKFESIFLCFKQMADAKSSFFQQNDEVLSKFDEAAVFRELDFLIFISQKYNQLKNLGLSGDILQENFPFLLSWYQPIRRLRFLIEYVEPTLFRKFVYKYTAEKFPQHLISVEDYVYSNNFWLFHDLVFAVCSDHTGWRSYFKETEEKLIQLGDSQIPVVDPSLSDNLREFFGVITSMSQKISGGWGGTITLLIQLIQVEYLCYAAVLIIFCVIFFLKVSFKILTFIRGAEKKGEK